ncbi:hypothetical protein BS78_04G258400 [Paspalum vaginatum]|nr:hypothetical protein BS78_04G258400 [Paspalum vaginatum]
MRIAMVFAPFFSLPGRSAGGSRRGRARVLRSPLHLPPFPPNLVCSLRNAGNSLSNERARQAGRVCDRDAFSLASERERWPPSKQGIAVARGGRLELELASRLEGTQDASQQVHRISKGGLCWGLGVGGAFVRRLLVFKSSVHAWLLEQYPTATAAAGHDACIDATCMMA